MYKKEFHGYWKRGVSQYWHIKRNKALMIHLAEENKHYDGDSHIFFSPYDGRNNHTHVGMNKISKEEFDAVRDLHIARLKEY